MSFVIAIVGMAKESYSGYDDFVGSKKSKTTARTIFHLLEEYSLDLALVARCTSIRIAKVVPFIHVRRHLKMAKSPEISTI
jgi:hypothetical protein